MKKGWCLVKRGATFSLFEKAGPEKLYFHMTYINPDIPEGEPLTECELGQKEQIAMFQDKGWTLVTSLNMIHIFCASYYCDIPRYYQTAKQQRKFYKKLKKNYISWSSIINAAIAICSIFLFPIIFSDNKNIFYRSVHRIRLCYIEDTAPFIFLLLLFFLHFCKDFYRAYRIKALYKRIQKEIPYRQEEKKYPVFFQALYKCMFTAAIVFLCLTIKEAIESREYKMPEISDGPYMLLKDLGFDGERTTL